ncbi:MAG: hypothetical protein HY914_18735 [Desulfomonile tiedjei]|nr:hypothetical protein [Desulfomonile tiedjei]
MVKCEKCGYVSFDYNVACPACNKDLAQVRSRLGIFYLPPEVGLEGFFTGASDVAKSAVKAAPAAAKHEEAELDLDSVGDDFEFTLDD